MKKRSQNKLELKKRAISNLKIEVLGGVANRPSDRLCTHECPTMGTCLRSLCIICEPLGA